MQIILRFNGHWECLEIGVIKWKDFYLVGVVVPALFSVP